MALGMRHHHRVNRVVHRSCFHSLSRARYLASLTPLNWAQTAFGQSFFVVGGGGNAVHFLCVLLTLVGIFDIRDLRLRDLRLRSH